MDEMSFAFTSKRLAPPLNNKRHKGQAGRIGVFGGSLEYTGAPYFAAISALRVGADLVHVFCSKEAGPVIKSYSPELIVHPLLDDKEAVNKISPWLERLHVILIGPGLGREPSTFSVIAEIIKLCRDSKKPLIIDADGLFYITQHVDAIKDYPAPGVILTPNAAEFARLIGENNPVEKIDATVLKILLLIMLKWLRLLVVGQVDVVVVKHQMEEDVPHDDRAMIACFAACRLTRECNARAFEKKGRGMVCSDMIEQVSYVFRDQFEFPLSTDTESTIMRILITVIILLFPILKTISVSNANKSVLKDVSEIVSGKDLIEQFDCDTVKRSDISFLLYVRNKNKSVELNDTNVNTILPNKKLIVIIHGWLADAFAYGMQDLKNAYLKRYNCNVIIVDWKSISHNLYSTAVCKLPKIAKHVVDLLVVLRKQAEISSSHIHIIGHSLGGQMCGLIGQKYFRRTKEKIDRLTGLDPAGPLYENKPIDKRIDSTDAVFVDIYHTNGGMFGYYGNCGTADIYIYCGSTQPTCFVPERKIFTENNIKKVGIFAVACNHLRSFDYMIEMVNEKYKATPCEWCPVGCPPLLSLFKNKIIVGEDCDRSAKGGYYVSINIF
ncbi:hypothetical protein RN001_003210 [Aquatica leii]|uniref:ATP-dependent (S)-NAD(P)H-hydrate dehydratase n=1 Tax=Aquatica leii TaxID=1421715 RepID=A0AAN7Q616_9COLE|nr:hypothetical protein RN001_003210 [Aquatica leii]